MCQRSSYKDSYVAILVLRNCHVIIFLFPKENNLDKIYILLKYHHRVLKILRLMTLALLQTHNFPLRPY
jgi:hypothetical protein